MADILSAPNGDYDPNILGAVLKRVVDTLNGNQITDTKPNSVAPSAAASSQGNWNDISTAFTGDFTKSGLDYAYTITGAATLGQPTSGYQFNPEMAPIAIYVKSTSGWNQGTSDNTGRTNSSGIRIKVDNYGQGDLTCFSAQGFVSGARSGATNVLANPAVSLFSGGTFAGAAGVYLNPVEINCDDQGFDAAGVGYVVNLTRTVNTAALGAFWNGYRSQSKGTKNVDSHYYGSGKATYCFDFSNTTGLTNVFNLGSNKPAVTGSRGGNAALASLLTALANLGLITDSTTA